MRLFLYLKLFVNRDCDALSELLSLDGLTLFWKYDLFAMELLALRAFGREFYYRQQLLFCA